MRRIEKIRRAQTLVSVLLFFIVFFICWKFTHFEMTTMQLSYWGMTDLWWLWSTGISVIAASMTFNSVIYIRDNHRIKNTTIPYTLFIISGLSLLIVGIFNVEYAIHNYAAYVYFFLYPLSIFSLAFLNRKTLAFKTWIIHLIFSMGMTIFPFSMLSAFSGFAISETIHSIFVMAWNIWILKKLE